MPTSVLLAVLAAAGLLALAPALVRRYDATERLVAERAQSTARVINRTRRRRTVPLPGRPLYAPRPADQDQVPEQRVRPAVGQSVWLHVDRIVLPVLPADLDSDTPSQVPLPQPVAPQVSPSEAASSRVTSTQADTVPISVRRVPSANSDGRAGARPAAARKAQPPQQSRGVLQPRNSQPSRGSQPSRRGASKVRDTVSIPNKSRPATRRRARTAQSPAVYRRRRVLAGLILLNVIELIGVTTVSAGFWTGFGVTLFLLGGYLVHLRNSAIVEARARRLSARHAARVAIVQAEIREENERRLAARREALRRAAATRATAQREAQRLSQRYVDHDPERGARVRGRAYETGKNYDDQAAGF